MKRVRRRLGWLFMIALAGVAAVIFGRWLFGLAECPRLQTALLYSSTTLTVIVMALYAVTARNNAIIVQLITVGLVLAIGLLLPSVGGSFLARVPEVRAVFCPSCDEAMATAQGLRVVGQLDGAEHLARQCLSENPDVRCRSIAGCELARVLYDKAGVLIQEGRCAEIDAVLSEAHALASELCADPDFLLAIEERRQYYKLACATPTPLPPPTPPPQPTPTLIDLQIEILRRQRTEESATIDFRILQAGGRLAGLPQSDFALSIADEVVPLLAFEERGIDDPVCMIVVVDTSGSVYPGLSQIRSAIAGLNDKRKPDDELGLVVFAGRDVVRVEQTPVRGPLNPDVFTEAEGPTALWDSILVGLDTALACSAEARYLLVLTDGSDNNSTHFEGEDLSQAARQIASLAEVSNIGICTVGVESEELEEEPLRLVAHGCGYRPAADFDAVVSLFQDIFGFVRDFYRIEFSPKVFSGGESTITLHVMDVMEMDVDFGD